MAGRHCCGGFVWAREVPHGEWAVELSFWGLGREGRAESKRLQ